MLCRTHHVALCMTAAAALSSHAQDWTNPGGNAQRNGLTNALGPDAPTLRWTDGTTSQTVGPVFTTDGVAVTIRGAGPAGDLDRDTAVAFHIATGARLWSRTLPRIGGEQRLWIAGAKDGRVYLSRADDFIYYDGFVHCVDARTGNTLWVSPEKHHADASQGGIFVDGGDLVLSTFSVVTRISAQDGATVWRTLKSNPYYAPTGVSFRGDAIYTAESNIYLPGPLIRRVEADTGLHGYLSPPVPGQRTLSLPVIAPDGTIYLVSDHYWNEFNRLHAFLDNGDVFTEVWSVPLGSFGGYYPAVLPDSSIILRGPNNTLQLRNAFNGSVVATSPTLPVTHSNPKFAVDGAGRIYMTDGSQGATRLYCFNADLTVRWSVDQPGGSLSLSAPALAEDGTLIVAGSAGVFAWSTDRCPSCTADHDQSGGIDGDDITAFFRDWQEGSPCADVDGSGGIDGDDIPRFFDAWDQGHC